MTYPPAPWALRGQLHALVFRVPALDLAVDPPPGWRLTRLGRWAIVATAWVSYGAGSVLTYRELMATTLVRRGWRVVPTVVAIWVDSEASRDGGRRLWGIPKELASFRFGDREFQASAAYAPIAAGSARRLRRVPGRWSLRFAVVQELDGAALVSPVRVRAGIDVASATFTPAADGPLAFLIGRKPVVSVTLRDFEMRFGREPTDTAP